MSCCDNDDVKHEITNCSFASCVTSVTSLNMIVYLHVTAGESKIKYTNQADQLLAIIRLIRQIACSLHRLRICVCMLQWRCLIALRRPLNVHYTSCQCVGNPDVSMSQRLVAGR